MENFLKYIKTKNPTKKQLIKLTFCIVAILALIFLIYTNNKITKNQKDISCEDAYTSEKTIYKKPITTFEEHKVNEIYTGEPAKLDLDSSFIAKRFRSYFTEALSEGSNFAGHYAIAEWGFTGVGREIGIVDVKTGKVYVFPYVAETEFSYKKDSNLLIVDPVEVICKNMGIVTSMGTSTSGKPFSEIKPFYFLWENETFKLLTPQDGQPSIDTAGNLTP